MLTPGTMMVSRAGEKIVRRACQCCGDDLNAHQARSSGICDRRRCHEWKIAQVGAQLLARRRRETLERLFAEAARPVEAAAFAVGSRPDEVVRAVVQWQGSTLAALPDDRRAEFEEHLRWLVEQAFASPAGADDGARAGLEAEEPELLRVACALCRGRCCDRGGTTALLQEEDIARWRRREPDVTPERVIATYLAALPVHSVQDACVFLGAGGCGLPRTLRNDWCNAFQCKERETMQAALGEGGDHRVVIVADDAEGDRAAAVLGWSAATGAVAVQVDAAPGEEGAA